LGGTLGGLILSMLWDKSGPQAVYLIAAVFALGGVAAAALSYHWQPHQKEKK
jgi:PPP family 3-phenylpropionic acid transporter